MTMTTEPQRRTIKKGLHGCIDGVQYTRGSIVRQNDGYVFSAAIGGYGVETSRRTVGGSGTTLTLRFETFVRSKIAAARVAATIPGQYVILTGMKGYMADQIILPRGCEIVAYNGNIGDVCTTVVFVPVTASSLSVVNSALAATDEDDPGNRVTVQIVRSPIEAVEDETDFHSLAHRFAYAAEVERKVTAAIHGDATIISTAATALLAGADVDTNIDAIRAALVRIERTREGI